jgi:LmbE family N-acetylglucosaminyl deacetylase
VKNIILSILAHPDDAEFLCVGTMARLVHEHGWTAHIASMTPGDCGSVDRPAEEISGVRRREGERAARLIGAAYHCLEERDLLIFYQERSLERVTRLVRQVRPRIILTHSPQDYMLDHETTSSLARTAAFAAPAPNFFAGRSHAPPLESIPHVYYCDAIEGKDLLGREILPEFLIDISRAIDTKTAMLAEHASQRQWLLRHHQMDEYIESMRRWGAQRGARCGVAYAEGFRQHLGHSYPQDNLLGELLGRLG